VNLNYNTEEGKVRTRNHYAELTPTPVANLQGSYNYKTGNASSFIADSSDGLVDSVEATLDVDFGSGTISNGNIHALTSGESWNIYFEGTVRRGRLDLDATSGQLINGRGLVSDNIDTSIGGLFTGDAAEAFVGGFDFVDRNNSANWIDGIFTIER